MGFKGKENKWKHWKQRQKINTKNETTSERRNNLRETH